MSFREEIFSGGQETPSYSIVAITTTNGDHPTTDCSGRANRSATLPNAGFIRRLFLQRQLYTTTKYSLFSYALSLPVLFSIERDDFGSLIFGQPPVSVIVAMRVVWNSGFVEVCALALAHSLVFRPNRLSCLLALSFYEGWHLLRQQQ